MFVPNQEEVLIVAHDPTELFVSTAPYYARYRAGYPEALFTDLAERFGLDGSKRVLDLGCGTGQIAIPLAPHVRQVIAVDPQPTMLHEGQVLAAERGITNIDWRQGDSTGLAAMGLDDLTLALMGASFHWMDRPAVLKVFDRIVRPDGAVIVVSGGSAYRADKPAWDDVVTAVRTRWLGPQRRAGSGTYSHPEQRHEEVLAASAFSRVEVVEFTSTLTRDLDSVVGLQFSYSYSAPAQLGDDAAAFEADLRRELLAANPSGIWTEDIRTEAIIAVRP